MTGRRSLAGVGRLSLIYTVGDDTRQSESAPVLSVSAGEDFAECSWPTVLKCKVEISKPRLLRYVDALADAVRRGFWMNAGCAPMLFWEWTGTVPPGLDATTVATPGTPSARCTAGTGRRADAGTGTECCLYLMDDAAHWHRPGFYGRIRGQTAVSTAVGEDFAVSSWPVVVKASAITPRDGLAQYLADLAGCIRDGLFVDVDRAVA